MTIAITGATGNIGSVLADRLLRAGADITLLVRNADKAQHFAERGAKLAVGDLTDEAFVVSATRGASALFWLTPPNYAATDFRAYQNRLGDNAAAAIRTNNIPYVVHLSSFGAHLGHSAGPVNGLYDIEKKLDAVAANIVHLRPGFFMENLFGNLATIKSAGAIFGPISPTATFPVIATRDIGEIAAQILGNLDWSGRTVRELQGPRHLSWSEIAGTLSGTLGREVKFVPVTAEQAIESMKGMGLPEDISSQYVELYQGIDKGVLRCEQPLGPQTATTTTLEQFAADILKPAIDNLG